VVDGCSVRPQKDWIAETFAKGQSADFEGWYRRWLDSLTPEQRELWKQLRRCRVDQEHGALT